jgi:ATP-dependent Clp protease adaptor protein ClpS
MGGDDQQGVGGTGTGAVVATKIRPRIRRPRRYQVLLHNDDYTTMDFVVMVLVTVFHRSESEAVRTMMQVHQQGAGVAGVYAYEVAEAKVAKVSRLARQSQFPLRCTMEPEEK